MSNITATTTTEEASAIWAEILASYTDATTGEVNYNQAFLDAVDGVFGYDVDDVLTAIVVNTNSLPEGVMAPEAYFADPNAYSELWSDTMIATYESLGDLYTSLKAPLDAFVSYGIYVGPTTDDGGDGDDSSIFSDINAFLSEQLTESVANDSTEETLNLFETPDLQEIMSYFIDHGSWGMALTLQTAYQSIPQARELMEAGLGVLQDASDQKTDLIDELGGLSADDPDAGYRSQEISQQLQIISAVETAINDVIKNQFDSLEREHQRNSDIASSENQTIQMIYRNWA